MFCTLLSIKCYIKKVGRGVSYKPKPYAYIDLSLHSTRNWHHLNNFSDLGLEGAYSICTVSRSLNIRYVSVAGPAATLTMALV